MVKRGKFIRDPARIDKKKILTVGGEIYILWTVSRPIWINHIKARKRNNKTEDAVHQFLDYFETHLNAKLRYHASTTIPRINSGES